MIYKEVKQLYKAEPEGDIGKLQQSKPFSCSPLTRLHVHAHFNMNIHTHIQHINTYKMEKVLSKLFKTLYIAFTLLYI